MRGFSGFRTIDCALAEDVTALAAELRELGQRRNDLNQSSPLIPRQAFEAVRRDIEAGEATHRVDQAG